MTATVLFIGGSRSWSWGSKIDRRRREPSRGAESAKGVRCGKGTPPYRRRGLGRGQCPQKKIFRS